MAEVDFDEFEDAVYAPARNDARAARLGRWLNYAGAASSVVLVVLLAVWGYKLAMRDVHGVPVMRALEGPMRVAPADPGGAEASNQGLSVNAIASTGVASPVAESLTLAPAATALSEDDQAGLAAAVAPAAVAPAPLAQPLSMIENAPDAQAASIEAQPAEPVTAAPASTEDAVNAALAEALADDPGQGLARSPVPRARPGVTAGQIPAAAAPPREVEPATIAVGTRLTQLGAFDGQDEARAKWALLSGQFGEVMAGKAMVIQPAQSGGKTFFRLRAEGFADEEDARRFCAVLKAGNSDCVPVTQR